MAATHQDPQILWLNHDILMRIIKMNANMFLDDDALKTTVISSQVCRLWREFMLSTPSLWAKLIDLNMLQYGTTDEWRDELMDRTGTALLWIAARGLAIPDDSTGIISFLSDILSNDWNRVQKISLDCIDGSYMHPGLPRWNPLYLPAPNLQTFDLDFSEGDLSSEDADEECMDLPLFCHDAPMLREFYARVLRFDFGAPWLQHLHLLHIDIEITVNEILTILEAAPRLRELIICQAELGEVAPSLPTISLPDLSHMVLFASFVGGATLLDHLELPLGCTMKIHLTNGVGDQDQDRTSEDLCRFRMQTVSRLARNIFRVYTPQKLLLNFSPDMLALEDHTQDDRRFEFHISYYGNRAPTLYTRMSFLEGFTLSELSQVTDFRLEVSIDLPETIFSSFIACLSSVTLLEAPAKTLVYLVELQDRLSKQLADRPIVVLPRVQTVRLNHSAITYFAGDQAQGVLMEYLRARVRDGCPIGTLDLTECNSDALPRVDFLEEMTGLKVLWKRWGVKDISEYICGSGDPDRLRRLRTFT